MQVFALLLALAAPAIDVPPENQKKAELPAMDTAEAGAKRILAAIVKNDPEPVLDLFFPAEPFDALKAIAQPRVYHDQLVKWYVADIHREHQRVKAFGPLEFDGFKRGACKWKEKGTEGNRIPYWSCYRNHFYAKPVGGDPKAKRLDFDLRAMINWGKSWYVTHLGPIPTK